MFFFASDGTLSAFQAVTLYITFTIGLLKNSLRELSLLTSVAPPPSDDGVKWLLRTRHGFTELYVFEFEKTTSRHRGE